MRAPAPLLVAISLVLNLTLARATTFDVPSPETPTIGAALGAAQDGDTILIAPGTYFESGYEILTHDLLIQGTTGDPADVVIDGQYIDRILIISETTGVVVRSMTFRHGFADPFLQESGGALLLEVHAEALIENCVFEEDSAGAGGAVSCLNYCQGTFRKCTFRANKGSTGAGLYATGATVILDSCLFELNSSEPDGSGGAVYCEPCSLYATGTRFENNAAGNNGGGIWLNLSFAELVDCRFEENEAGYWGGALFSNASIVLADNPLLTQNTAQMGGGAYFYNGSGGAMHGGAFTHNQALGTEGGGAVFLDQSTTTISSAFLVSNTSGGPGGAMVIRGNARPDFVDSCTFEGNTADGTGGAVFADGNGGDPDFHFNYCVFTGNQSTSGDGAASVQSWSPLWLSNCTVVGNTPGDPGGAAVGCRDHASVALDHSIFAFASSGRAVYCDTSSSFFAECSDVYGNPGGDWVDCLAPLDSIYLNFSADPMFCGPEASPSRPYQLQGASPCASDTCGYIGAEEVGCGFVKSWVGAGDGLNWEDDENWDPTGVPGPNDDVRLTTQGQFEVRLSSPASIFRLTVGGPGSYFNLLVDGAPLAIAEGGENLSSITLMEGSALQFAAGSLFTSVPGALVMLEGGDLTGEGVIVNGGNVEKWYPLTTSRISCPFENRLDDPGDGALHVWEGALEVEGPFANSGTINVHDSAVMRLDPGDGPLRTDVLTNNGLIVVESGSAIELSTPATVFLNLGSGVVELQGGDITGPGVFRNYGLVKKTDPEGLARALSHVASRLENLVDDPGDGAVRVEEGSLAIEGVFENAGSLYVYTAAAMLLDPGDGPLRADQLTNTGVVIIQSGSTLTIDPAGTVFLNTATGEVRLQGSGQILGAGLLRNYGLFVKEDPLKSRAVGHVAATFENSTSDPGDGAVHVDDGTLWVEGEFTNAGSVIVNDAAALLLDPGEGPLRGGAGAKTLTDGLATNLVGGDWEVAGTLTLETGASLTNYGFVSIESAASIVNDGVFDLRENGVLAGRGTFDNLGGTFTGGGVIRPGASVGTLSFLGDFSQTATGEIEVEIGGTTPGTGHDRLAITGSATLDGALYVTLLPGFVPVEGDSFAVITSGGVLARTSFDCLSGLDAPGELFLDPVEETGLFALVARDSTSANGAPVATNDHDSTDAATPITIRVLANDTDPEMQDLRVALVSTAGTSGAVTILAGDSLLLYIPVRSFSGQDAFAYAVTDCEGGTDVATVTIGVARAPRAWLVPVDQPTITDGLAAAWAKDTVIVSNGTYHESFLAMKSGVVLRSETMNPATVIVDPDSLSRGLYCSGLDSTTAVIGITFMGGSATSGAGAYILDSDMTLDRCVFRGNYASSLGGGLKAEDCDPVIRRCVFEGNGAFAGAGGISLDSSNAIVESCQVISNRVTYNGGAFFIRYFAPAFRSCTFANNVATAGTSGSVFYVIAAHPTLENTIVCANTGAQTATCASGGTVTLSCCDVYGNSGGNYVGCFAGQGGINQNISADPRFCQFGNADDPFAIMMGSPCAPDNNPDCGLVGARPVGCGAVTGIADAPPPALEYRLFANRPNPFNPTTTIRFSLPRAERATLVMYDIAGRRVATLAEGVLGPGEFDATWNGTDVSGRSASSGVYFARLIAGEFTAVRKMVLLR